MAHEPQTSPSSIAFSDDPAIAALRTATGELSDLNAIGSLLDWDMETKIPPKGMEVRAAQSSLLSGIAHDYRVAPALEQAISAAETVAASPASALTVADRALITIARREYRRETALSRQLVVDLAHARSRGHDLWLQARTSQDFTSFVPALERIVDLMKAYAQAIDAQRPAYETLFDDYEFGMPLEEATQALATLRDATIPLIRKAQAHNQIDDSCLRGHFPEPAQLQFGEQILKAMGYDFAAGRLDTTVHPFMTSFGSPFDVRVTTRVKEAEIDFALLSTMHEGGHALYEQGIDPTLVRTPLAGGTSSALHESQSRFWENFIGRSLPFWQGQYHLLQSAFPVYRDVPVETFVAALNRIAPSLIRIEADELTYNLHIIIRFEIEQDLFAGKIAVRDLSEIWNQKYQAYLGVTPAHATEGVLQDVHWSAGLFGYFPTYSLGNMYAAQFMAKLRQEFPDLDTRLAGGDTAFIREWQREHLHRWGSIYTARELCEQVTGEPINPRYLIEHLTRKVDTYYHA